MGRLCGAELCGESPTLACAGLSLMPRLRIFLVDWEGSHKIQRQRPGASDSFSASDRRVRNGRGWHSSQGEVSEVSSGVSNEGARLRIMILLCMRKAQAHLIFVIHIQLV